MKQSPRKNLLINKPFQIRMLFYANLIAVSLIASFGAGVYFFTSRMNRLVESLGGENSQLVTQYFELQERSLFALLGFISFCAFFLICSSVMVLSHRIAGPLYRLNQHLNAVASGETLSDVKFRGKDFFPELAVSCNRLMEKLRLNLLKQK